MKIIFPNPFGLRPTATTSKEEVQRVLELQIEYRFSSQYRDFLLTQNGFISDAFCHSNAKANYLVEHDVANPSQDFQQLLAYDAHEEYFDVEHVNGFNLFSEFFFVIGNDKGGNQFVEVLNGKFKGWIGSLDHGMYAISRSVGEFIEDNNDFFADKSHLLTDYQKITSRELGLIAFHATSMDDFLENCFVYSSYDGEDRMEIFIVGSPPS